MNKKHYDVVCAIIKDDDKYFCCKRGPKGECAFMWEFPGGKIEPGETKEQAIIREIEEELSATISPDKFLVTIDHEYNTFSLTMSAFICSIVKGEIVLSEHKDSKWCTIQEISNVEFAPADKKIVIELIKLYK